MISPKTQARKNTDDTIARLKTKLDGNWTIGRLVEDLVRAIHKERQVVEDENSLRTNQELLSIKSVLYSVPEKKQ